MQLSSDGFLENQFSWYQYKGWVNYTGCVSVWVFTMLVHAMMSFMGMNIIKGHSVYKKTITAGSYQNHRENTVPQLSFYQQLKNVPKI